MRVELAGHVLAVVVVVAFLSAPGHTYILPDDVIPRTQAHHHHRLRQQRQQQQQQQHAKLTTDNGVTQLDVSVKPQYALMHRSKRVTVNCTAVANNERPYISFFVSRCTMFHFSSLCPPCRWRLSGSWR